MHGEDMSKWTHDHQFDQGSARAERSTRIVLWITLVTMVLEITAGWWFNSMALLADGWHMGSHALAIGLTVFAYATARRYAHDPRFAFGTWKIEILSGFASAIFLLAIAGLMVVGSVERLLDPQVIQYREAMAVAALGLTVNIVCAALLGQAHHHGHHPHHGHGHGHHHGHDDHHGHDHHQGHDHHPHDHAGPHQHHDLNLKSAYVHVITDAATSVLALVALAGGWWYGWSWLDPVMGIVGAVVVALWAKSLIIETGKVLLDREMDHPVVAEIREVLEVGDTRISDLHVWRVGRNVYSCAVAVVTHDRSLTADDIRKRLAVHQEIVHSTIELQHCEQAHASPCVGA